MSLFGDIERLITEHGSAAILRERIELAKQQYEVLEKKVSELQSENDTLRMQLKQSQTEAEKLKKLVASQSDKPSDFDETTHKILKIFFSQSDDVSADEIAVQIGIEEGMVEYYFDQLREAGFITQTHVGFTFGDTSSPPAFGITAKGRKYVVTNKL